MSSLAENIRCTSMAWYSMTEQQIRLDLSAIASRMGYNGTAQNILQIGRTPRIPFKVMVAYVAILEKRK